MSYVIPDPLSGWFEPDPRIHSKPSCECEDNRPLCWVCVAEWAATFSDAEIHFVDTAPPEDDPWPALQADPQDDDVWTRHEQMERCDEDL